MTAPTAMRLVLITGLSGAGRSTAAKALEDLGWFVVDNLPPTLIESVVDLAARTQGSVDRVAVVVDVRSHGFTTDTAEALRRLEQSGTPVSVVFLEAADDVLVRRFDGVRRPHPLQGSGRVVDGLARERDLLRTLRGDADLVLDTSELNIHELRAKVTAAFETSETAVLHATVLSFGYKYGVPLDADVVIDCRLIANPHWVPELRPLSGLDAPVRDYVLAQPGAAELVGTAGDLLAAYAPGYVAQGKLFATFAVGCTGGRHRSVTIATILGERLRAAGADVTVVHRDLERE